MLNVVQKDEIQYLFSSVSKPVSGVTVKIQWIH